MIHPPHRRIAASVLVAVALSARGGPVGAQPRADSTRAAAQAFQRGVTAMDAHQYRVAVDALEESYRLHPSAVALYNLGLAYRELGGVHRAIESFERYLADGTGQVSAERAATVHEALGQLRAQVAVVQLDVRLPAYVVTLDGREVSLTDGAIPMDPGDHVLVVTAPQHRPWRDELRLRPGERARRAVALEPEASPRVSPPAAVAQVAAPHPALAPSPAASASTSILSRWWFWAGLGLLVAGGVAVGVAVGASGSQEPLVPGTAFDVQTLHAPLRF